MQAWEEFIQSLEGDLGKGTVSKWLRTLKVVDFDACNLYLEAPDALHLFWFEEHVRTRAVRTLRNKNHRPIKIHLTSAKGEVPQKRRRIKPPPPAEPMHRFTTPSDAIDPQATFEQFITSSVNEYPLKFLHKVAAKEALATFNPLFISGEKSSGKSHLLMALTHALRNGGLNVHYASTQTFTEHLIQAIRQSKMDIFRTNYRKLDVLILDDIHLLSRRLATQEELFHTFNALHSSGRQIVLCSHLSPSQLEEIEPRLISRFEWGLTLEIKPLNQENRALLLKLRAENAHFTITDDVAPFFVTTFPTTRALLIAFDTLMLRAEDKKMRSVDLDQIKILIPDIIEATRQQEITPEHIIASVANYFDVEKGDILGKAQTKECALPRQVAMYFCRNELKLPFKQIGRIFSRDHSTVMASIRQIQTNIESQEKEICTSIVEVHKKIKH